VLIERPEGGRREGRREYQPDDVAAQFRAQRGMLDVGGRLSGDAVFAEVRAVIEYL
jgi:hypothetical protein